QLLLRVRAVLDDLAAELVAEHHVARRVHRPASAGTPGALDELVGVFCRVQISAADAAAQRLYEHLACSGFRIGDCIHDDIAVAKDRGAHDVPRCFYASIARMSGRCSRPQNSSSSMMKLGTPNTPRSSAARLIAATSSRSSGARAANAVPSAPA